jgi:hypothetical protein
MFRPVSRTRGWSLRPVSSTKTEYWRVSATRSVDRRQRFAARQKPEQVPPSDKPAEGPKQQPEEQAQCRPGAK